MAKFISWLQDACAYVNDEAVHPSVRGYPFLSSPFPILAVVFVYVYFCKYYGPRMMSTRDAFNMKPVMILYNAFQIIVSAWIFVQGATYAWPTRYKFFCEPVNISSSDDSIWVAQLMVVYFWLKIVELLDTVFFVLRKKLNQVTFLHLYHHILMVLVTYLAAKYFPGGHMTSVGQINSIAHVVMYAYYLLTSIDSKYSEMIRFKKFITLMQIVQFAILFLQSFPTLFWENCDYSKALRAMMSVQSIFMICLFSNFYVTAYRKKKTK